MGHLIEPGSPEWLRVITPSKVAAIVGVSRYESAFGLWQRMKGILDPEPHKDIFDTGHAFELALGYLWKLENPGWRLSGGPTGPGSTRHVVQAASDEFGFPAVATVDRRASRGKHRRVVEFKTARDLAEWGDEFTGNCPGDYYTQVQMQMAITGWTEQPAHLMVMGPFFRHYTYVIEYNADQVDRLMMVCRAFWDSLAGDEPPPLDNHKATYYALKELHPDIERGKEVEVPRDLLCASREAREMKKQAESWQQENDIKLLDLLGNAQYGTVNGIQFVNRKPHGKGGVALSVNTKKDLPAEDVQTEGAQSA